jgi:hypothetical protein
MLYWITRSDPWYANIVNFVVAGYVPLGADKRKLIYESHHHGMSHTSSESAQTDSLESVYQLKKESILLKDATHHHTEVIMGHSVLMQKSSKVDSSGQLCMKTRRISSEGVEHVKDTGISIQEMPCHSQTTFRLNSLMSRALTT